MKSFEKPKMSFVMYWVARWYAMRAFFMFVSRSRLSASVIRGRPKFGKEDEVEEDEDDVDDEEPEDDDDDDEEDVEV